MGWCPECVGGSCEGLGFHLALWNCGAVAGRTLAIGDSLSAGLEDGVREERLTFCKE